MCIHYAMHGVCKNIRNGSGNKSIGVRCHLSHDLEAIVDHVWGKGQQPCGSRFGPCIRKFGLNLLMLAINLLKRPVKFKRAHLKSKIFMAPAQQKNTES